MKEWHEEDEATKWEEIRSSRELRQPRKGEGIGTLGWCVGK